ncbi:MAG: YbbR-like domain-containing protein [Bacteroidetes bacterium]|nr:YbbR-like domain-containing protein [Bacteroidota bacterium]
MCFKAEPVGNVISKCYLVLMNEMPDHLSLKIESRGFNLMSYKYFTTLEPIVVDITDLKERRIGKLSHRFLLTSSIRNNISSQIKGKVDVLLIQPDTLHFKFDRRKKKTVPVRFVKHLEFEPNYQVYGNILLEPARVEINGSKLMLDTITEVRTEIMSLKGLNKNVSNKAKLDMGLYKQKVESTVKYVNVDIGVEKYTEGFAEADVEVTNLPENFRVNTFPSSVKVRYLVALKDYEAVQGDNFLVKADFLKERSSPNKLELKISEISSRVELIAIEPDNVEFIINK